MCLSKFPGWVKCYFWLSSRWPKRNWMLRGFIYIILPTLRLLCDDFETYTSLLSTSTASTTSVGCQLRWLWQLPKRPSSVQDVKITLFWDLGYLVDHWWLVSLWLVTHLWWMNYNFPQDFLEFTTGPFCLCGKHGPCSSFGWWRGGSLEWPDTGGWPFLLQTLHALLREAHSPPHYQINMLRKIKVLSYVDDWIPHTCKRMFCQAY